MESPEADHAVPHAQDSATGAGGTRLQPPLNFSSRIKSFQGSEVPRPVDVGCGCLRGLVGRIEGVDSVHTLGHGLGRTVGGLARIAEVFGGVADIQGLEPGSSPTSGTCFPCSGAS